MKESVKAVDSVAVLTPKRCSKEKVADKINSGPGVLLIGNNIFVFLIVNGVRC